MLPRIYVKIPPKVKKYFRDNLGAPFIIGFQLLLLVCASLLIQGSTSAANEIAIVAYSMLVVGVILQFIMYIKHRDEEGREKG
jgi:hypothetical protein